MILHEIAHALVDYHGHDDVWRSKALEIGCSGKRHGLSGVSIRGRYEATCKKGHKFYAHRLRKEGCSW